MNRRALGGVVALVVVLVGVWFFWLRGNDAESEKREAEDGKRSAAINVVRPGDKPEQPQRQQAPRWTLDTDPSGPLRMEGQVLGPDGKGVAGAEVWLASVPPRSTKTEDDGGFAFDKLVGRTYALTASSGELVGGPVMYKLTGSSDPVVVRLGEGASVIVTVTDASKKPLEGVDVMVGDLSRKTARTDAKGEVTLRPVRPGWVYVQATASGFAPGSGSATVGSAGATGRVAITLKKGFAVSGRVIDEAGKPIAKARVFAGGGAWNADAGVDEKQDDAITTDAKGAFAIPAVANGQHVIAALDGDHAPGYTTITVADQALANVEITMKTGGLVAGTVVDATGKVTPYATVKIAGTNAQWDVSARQATTDERGKFELRGLTRSKMSARAESDRAASKLVEVDLTVEPVKRDLKLVLDVTGMISGIVVDDKGAPVAEVSVHSMPDFLSGESLEGIALAGGSTATTDGAGAFTLYGLTDGKHRVWAARKSGNWDWGKDGAVARTGDKGVRVVLPTNGQLVGKLVLSTGATPKLAKVRLGYDAPLSSVDGTFTFKDVAPGEYTMTILGPEFSETNKHDVVVIAGKTTDLGTITVHRGRRLAGRVVDGSGTAVANAQVKVGEMLIEGEGDGDDFDDDKSDDGTSRSKTAVTGADGTFSITGIPSRPTNVVAEHANGRSIAIPVPAGNDDPQPLTLTLKGFGSITGVVTLKGQPVEGVSVGAAPKGGGAQAVFAQTDDKGRFKLTKVPEGAQALQAMQQKMMSLKSTTVNVNVVAGQETKVNIEIPVGQITLGVTIKAQPGHKVDSAQVFLFNGMVVLKDAKQLVDGLFQGGMQGMKLWFGGDSAMPEFEELVAGEYSICSVPITGNMMEVQQKMQQNMHLVKVYCRQVKVTPGPLKQSVVHEVPSMDPLPKS